VSSGKISRSTFIKSKKRESNTNSTIHTFFFDCSGAMLQIVVFSIFEYRFTQNGISFPLLARCRQVVIFKNHPFPNREGEKKNDSQ